jgi:EAL domain-containing protein (putative c-di-GMP-specific phosphodiesterase class I)
MSKLFQLPKSYFKAGECLFSEGDKGDFAYIIDYGKIEISTIINGKNTILNILEPGDMFGELALVDGSPRSASAYAKTDVLLTIITPEQVNIRIKDADPILRLLLMIVMSYFRSETKRFRSKNSPKKLKLLSFEQNLYQEKITETIDLIRLESDLRDAIEQKELELLYQPIINFKTQKIVGFEILLRWKCSKRGYVSPSLFIPLAESTSLIIPIGEWLIKKAIEDLLEIKKRTHKDLFISLNIAQRQIESQKFLPLLKQEILLAGIKRNQIKLEILERSLLTEETALFWVESCRSAGFPLLIDDFGTGYANLSYLKNFQFDSVKIDKCFIDDLNHSKKDRSICKALIELSHGLEMTIVAEGIETKAQAKILQEFGCDFGQGYFFSKPLSLKEAIALLC